MHKKIQIGLLTLVVAFLAQSCSPLISPYDQYAYIQATSLKVDALNLMDSATDSVQLHEKDINTIVTNLQKIYEYEKNRPKDTATTSQWKLMIDTSGHLFGGFITRWKKEKVLRKAYVEDKKIQIGFCFDQISELESKKIKPSQISNN